jgi:KDO2-lipid IV(A) lauroyltransferase
LNERAGRDADRRKQARRARHAARRDAKRRRAVFLLLLLRGAVRWLPMPVACALGDGLGTLAYAISGRFRRQTQAHIALAMPELAASERRRIARRSFALLGRGGCAFFVAHRLGAERALVRVQADGIEHMEAALAGGKGALLVTFHFGAFEILASGIGTRFGARAVGRASDDVGPTAVLIQMRRELGCDTIERGEPLAIIRTLRAGRPVAMLIDQDTSDVRGGFVPFFGRLAHTPLGPAALAVRTGVPVVMGFIAWEGLTRHRVTVMPPLFARPDLSGEEATLELTARMTRIGEEQVRRRPDHWVWVHRRWETRPEDHPDYAVWRGADA